MNLKVIILSYLPNLDSHPLESQEGQNFGEESVPGDFEGGYIAEAQDCTSNPELNNEGDQPPHSSSSFESEDDRSNFDMMYGGYFPCREEGCDKTFRDEVSLKKHVLTHSEKQFICNVNGCGKKFLDNCKLKRHRLVHSGVKNFRCHICGKKFSLDFNLRTHIRTHTGEKPYVCEFPG